MNENTEHGVQVETADGQFWNRRYSRQVEQGERLEISRNLVGLFGLLAEWERRQEELPLANNGSGE